MIVSKIILKNYRNYDNVELEFSPKLNVIIGDNATGKTNIVEAIHFLSLGRSFRTPECDELIKIGREFASIGARVEENTTHKDIVAIITPSSKKFVCNNKPVKRISELSSLINVIVFEPKDSLMFHYPPSVRRNFLDVNLSKKSPIYLENLMMFDKLLKERNALLKDDVIDGYQLEIITRQMVSIQETICKYRQAYISEINTVLPKIVKNIKGGEQDISLEYESFVKVDNNFVQNATRAYERSLESDVKHKMTQIGIHREDIKMIYKGHDISTHGSQGENRIAVLALKLCPYFLIEEDGKKPIIVLDDVMSELDKDVRARLTKFLTKFEQVFVTSTEIEIKNSSIYEVTKANTIRRNA